MSKVRKPPSPRKTNQLRIIAGKWRSRRILFPDVDGLRPTGDRLRETLFNWIGMELPGARCLDAFAGSGVLGLEALSRGAGGAVLLDCNPVVYRTLTATVAQLEAGAGAAVICADAEQWLRRRGDQAPFDIIFLDPPFASDVLPEIVPLIHGQDWLAPGGLVYIETASDVSVAVPQDWSRIKERSAGGVVCRLYRRI